MRDRLSLFVVFVLLIANIASFLTLYTMQRRADIQREEIRRNQERLRCILLEIPVEERSPEAERRVCGGGNP